MTYEIESDSSMTFKDGTEPTGPIRSAKFRVNVRTEYTMVEIVQDGGEAITAVISKEQIEAIAAAIKGGN